jgi:pyruvate,water dikinase
MSEQELARDILALGKGAACARGIGNKAALLDKASSAGLPVPRGFIVTEEALNWMIRNGIAQKSAERISVCRKLEFARLAGIDSLPAPFAVRSAFSAEDTANMSLAGFFKSRLFVDRDRLDDALSEIWSSALNYKESLRHDVLLMAMVRAEHAGVAFSQHDYLDDLINFTTGTADRLVSGVVEGESFTLPRLGTALPYSHSIPPFAMRLRTLLDRIRQVFAEGDWDVEWADDGNCCWLIQIRPITVSPRRNEVFTIANHREILPELPSLFMSSMIESCSDSLFEYYRTFDATLPDKRPFIETFKGRPYINLSLLSEMMRTFGLPTRLVTANIGGNATEEYPTDLRRMFRKLPVLLKLLIAQLQSVADAEATIAEMLSRTEQPGETVQKCIETLQWLYKSLVTAMFSLTQAMGWPLLVLRRAGVLEEHNSRQTTISAQMYKDLEALQDLCLNRPDLKVPLEQGLIPNDSQFQGLWLEYLKKHGHRGIFESDIARPRFREDPSTILSAIVYPVRRKVVSPSRSLAGLFTLPIWWQASRAIKTRERLRYFAMIAMERIRNRLLNLTEQRFPEPSTLWDLDITEAKQLDSGWIPSPEFWDARRQQQLQLASFRLPDLLHRFDDLETFSKDRMIAEGAKSLNGVSLTSGDVTGIALVLNEPTQVKHRHGEDGDTILVARSVDAGWIPTFARVCGVVVEIGGDLSHGSIILREIGLPAITNVRNATSVIRTGDRITLRAGAGVVEVSSTAAG